MRSGVLLRFSLIVACLACASSLHAQQISSGSKASSAAATAKAASLFGHNLLINGNAEAQMKGKAVPGWGDPQEGFSTPEYGSVGSEWDWGLSGCPACGKQYFHLEWEADGGERSFSQVVDVSHQAAAIDAGKVTGTLDGYFGAFRDADTSDHLVATYFDESGKELGMIETPWVDTKALQPAKAGSTSLMALEAHGPVPAGTRKIAVKLVAKATGTSGSYLGLADNLSLVLNQTQ